MYEQIDGKKQRKNCSLQYSLFKALAWLNYIKDLRYNPKIDEQYFWDLVDGLLI